MHTTLALAPRANGDARPVLPLFVVGYFRTASGLGQSARLCLQACRALGYDARAIDISTAHMQPADLPLPDRGGDGRSHDGPGTVILHVNAPLVPLALMQLGRAFVRHKHVVGYWAWELARVPADWRHAARHVHQVWVPSRFTAEAVRAAMPELPIRVVAHPLAVRAHSAAAARKDRFRVLMVFNAASGFARKNPCAGIAAFRAAFARDADAELIVKSSNLDADAAAGGMLQGSIAGARNIRHIPEVLAPAELDALYASADAVLSLHRSEGFGLVPAEGMLHAKPVVATGWSGTTDFLDADNGCPVRYRLVPARDPGGIYDFPELVWADADTDHAAELLRRLANDADLRRRIGERAAADARRLFSLETYAAALHDVLET